MEIWQNELKNSITTISDLKKYIEITSDEESAFVNSSMPFKITPHILQQIMYNDHSGAIRKQFIPIQFNDASSLNFEEDYLNETANEVCDNLVMRYPHKAILLVTNMCSAYCQFCTRKRTVAMSSQKNDLSNAFKYLSNNSNIYDLVISGGDPLILDNSKLEEIFYKLRNINSLKFIRLNTRIPVTLPSRINKNLIELLKKYNINYINIHFEHPDELCDETINACMKLANNGILLGSQSVLLKGINNDCQTLKKLFNKLLMSKIRPYYLYQCDKVTGCQPFYVNPTEGVNIINSILEELPGLSIPRFVIDAPGKMGKITIAPNGLIDCQKNSFLLKNFQNGNEFVYEF